MVEDLQACRGVAPSAIGELAWILDLLVQSAPYARPALAELDDSLLPGIAAQREAVRGRYQELWQDAVAGCPELPLMAHHAGQLVEPDPTGFLRWLGQATNHPPPDYELLSEPPTSRGPITSRLRRLCGEGSLRNRYAGLLREVWSAARPAWVRDGHRIALEASSSWLKRIERGGHIEDMVAPRHPLTRTSPETDELFSERREYLLSPLYFCMSGGTVIDLGDYVHITVAASDLLPIRRVRDAMFVADRLRVLSEPTRVHVLIQLMSTPAGVMDVARALKISQPTVSGHVKALRRHGLIQQRRLASRTVFVASRRRIERLLEDARATLARWE